MLQTAEQVFVSAVAAHVGDVFLAGGRGKVTVQIALHLIAVSAAVAARARTECQAGYIRFDQAVVQVAFAAFGIGKVVVADLPPALLRQILDRIGILQRLRVEAGRRRKRAFFYHAVDGQEGITVEGVSIETRQRQGGRNAQVIMPDFIVLPRQAENQIGHDYGIQPAQLFQIGSRFFAAVFAPQTAADGGIESLHADGNAVYARIDAGLCLGYIEMAHAAFQREFAIVGQRQITVAGLDQANQIVGQKRGGRAAAEIDGADFAVPVADFGFLRQLSDNFIGIGTAVIVFPGVAVEAAENAMVGAERDVKVGQGVFL